MTGRFAKLKEMGNKVAQDMRQDFVEFRTERKFKEAVADICKELTAPYFREMVVRGYTLKQLMKEMKRTVPQHERNAGTEYLMQMSDAKIVELIREVAPEHAAILDEYPDFRATTVSDLKEMAAGSAS